MLELMLVQDVLEKQSHRQVELRQQPNELEDQKWFVVQ